MLKNVEIRSVAERDLPPAPTGRTGSITSMCEVGPDHYGDPALFVALYFRPDGIRAPTAHRTAHAIYDGALSMLVEDRFARTCANDFADERQVLAR